MNKSIGNSCISIIPTCDRNNGKRQSEIVSGLPKTIPNTGGEYPFEGVLDSPRNGFKDASRWFFPRVGICYDFRGLENVRVWMCGEPRYEAADNSDPNNVTGKIIKVQKKIPGDEYTYSKIFWEEIDVETFEREKGGENSK